jgi:anti-sigma B factor antagonist
MEVTSPPPPKESRTYRMTNLKIEKRQVGDVTILDMSGKLRIGEIGPVFCSTIHDLVEEGRRKIILNLQGITHIDSTGLGELIASYNTLDKNGGRVKLLALTQKVRELMILTKLLTVFDIYEREQKALDSFQSMAPGAENGPSPPIGEVSRETLPLHTSSAKGG